MNKLLLLVPFTCVSLMAAAALPAPQADPAQYGAFHGRSADAKKKVMGFASSEATSPVKRVMAFAGEGCAEVEKYGKLIPVVSEDFSLLTTGSEEAPDLETNLEIPQWLTDENGFILTDQFGNPIPNPDFEYPWNNMRHEFLQVPGWGVGNAYPAGGMLFIPLSKESPEGKFNSHWLDLSQCDGNFVVEFRAKLAPSEEYDPSTGIPQAIILVEAAETNNMGPTWNNIETPFVNYDLLSTTEWTTFRILFQGGGPSTIANIVAQGNHGGLYLDDVTIYSLEPHVYAPNHTGHADFTADAFTINWSEIEGADKYLVDCWCVNPLQQLEYLVKDKEVTGATSLRIEGADMRDTYYYQVRAVKGDQISMAKEAREVFDIITPTMKKAVATDDDNRSFKGGVEPIVTAFGYNYFAQAERKAETDGPFLITNEDFTGWTHPLYEEGEWYDKEHPVDDKVTTLYYPTDIKQQGWYGENFQIYRDYICLVPFFYESTNGREQDCWVSPEFDLSKDGGKISIDVKLAADYDINYETYSSLALALFNYNESKGDYEQVELVYARDLTFDWQERHLELTKGSSRSKIGFFGVGSYGDLYVDDIRISQNYKAGESFMDPFFFRTWQLAESEEFMDDPTTFHFTVPDYASGTDIYQKAQAVRMHLDSEGKYDGEKESNFSDNDHVAYVKDFSGVQLVESAIAANVKVAAGNIIISNPEGLEVAVSTVDGKTVALGNAAEISYAPGVNGVFVVRIGSDSIKIAL